MGVLPLIFTVTLLAPPEVVSEPGTKMPPTVGLPVLGAIFSAVLAGKSRLPLMVKLAVVAPPPPDNALPAISVTGELIVPLPVSVPPLATLIAALTVPAPLTAKVPPLLTAMAPAPLRAPETFSRPPLMVVLPL